MRRLRLFLVVLGILLAAAAAGFFDFPEYVNHGIDSINAKKNEVGFLNKTPNIPQVPNRAFRLGLDLQGGIHLVYEADLSNIKREDYDSAIESLRDAIERRVNFFGVSEPIVQAEGNGDKRRLIVELAGVIDPKQAVKIIKETPFLEFKEERPLEESKARLRKALGEEVPEEQLGLICQSPDPQFLFVVEQTQGEDPCYQSLSPRFTGGYLKRAEVDLSQPTQPAIALQFNDEGAKLFEEVTKRNVGKRLAIYLDNQLLQSPVVQEAIAGGQARITGSFTAQEVQKAVRELNAGALPVPISPIFQTSVGPTLGEMSLKQSLQAGIVGLGLVAVFMILFYRLPGVIASLALVLYALFTLAVLKGIATTFTLAGVAGLILSVGMAVDANILIFSRMREELREGKRFSTALEEGFQRAWPSIRDGNVTTLLAAIILFWFGSSFVQGFALTLGVGILMSMVSAIFVTKIFLRLFVDTKLSEIRWLWK